MGTALPRVALTPVEPARRAKSWREALRRNHVLVILNGAGDHRKSSLCPQTQPIPVWDAASGLHLQAERGSTSRGERGPRRQHQQVTSYLVKFFYPPDQVGVTGGVLKKDVIWNTAKRQSTRVRRRLADEHFLCLRRPPPPLGC